MEKRRLGNLRPEAGRLLASIDDSLRDLRLADVERQTVDQLQQLLNDLKAALRDIP